MLKRFMIGFVIGVGAMYWYIHNYESTLSDADQWMERSASHTAVIGTINSSKTQTGRAKP